MTERSPGLGLMSIGINLIQQQDWMIVLQLLPDDGGFIAEVGFAGAGWIWPVIVPLLAAVVAFFATRAAAFARLREQT